MLLTVIPDSHIREINNAYVSLTKEDNVLKRVNMQIMVSDYVSIKDEYTENNSKFSLFAINASIFQ